MSDEIMLVLGEDGVAKKYDDTWDITIHCESEEEQKLVWEKLNNSKQEDCNKLAKDTNVPCKDTISRRMITEHLKQRLWETALNNAGIKCYADEIYSDIADKRLDSWMNELCIKEIPSAQSEWNNHTVACLLAELFDDTCACNYNGIDEWLPSKCELLDSCPNPVGIACWEQYLKHRAERRTDG